MSEEKRSLDYLGPVASTAAYLRHHPGSEPARCRRDEAVRRAVRAHPLAAVAASAGLAPRAVAEIVLSAVPPGPAATGESSRRARATR